MAKVNFGTLAADARGKVDGIVYSKNRSGAYVRTKVTPVNPGTVHQANARSILGVLSQQWSGTFDDAGRAAWTTFANTFTINNIFGNAIALNGLNYSVRINAVLSQIGATLLVIPPASPATTPIPIDTTSLVVASGLTISFDQTALPATAGTLFYIYATPGLPAGRNATQSDYRLLGTAAPASTGSLPHVINFTTIYTARFGAFVVGTRIAVLVSTVDPLVGVPTVAQPMTTIVT